MPRTALPVAACVVCCTGCPGSRADAWILRQTSLSRFYDQYFPSRDAFNGYAPFYYLLGDSGFKLLPWLMTPFSRKQENDTRKPQATRARYKEYSKDQKSTRACVENAFGVLKARWNCLRDGLQCDLKHTSVTVLACVVLHNICIARGDTWSEFNPVDDADRDRGTRRQPEWLLVDRRAAQPQPADSREQSKVGKLNRELLSRLPRNNRRNHQQG